jgi:thymidylate synthase
MHYQFQDVNHAFVSMVQEFDNLKNRVQHHSIVKKDSRNGPVIMFEEPVTVTYQRPMQRVLFNQARDCNPFFHLFESLWMLAGRDDVDSLKTYNSNIANYSDDGSTFNGAYGYRWRHGEIATNNENHDWEIVDQLEVIIERLKKYPNDRRCVLQMWNIEDDLMQMDTSLDVCCNTHAYFLLREGVPSDHGDGGGLSRYLDMTVCNRSNDMIWGMLGANVVHFSFLLEYMAAAIGVEVGVYNQFTNNLHVYEEKFQPKKWLNNDDPQVWYGKSQPLITAGDVPLVKDKATFDKELQKFIDNPLSTACTEPFLQDVAQPMCRAFHHHKERQYTGVGGAYDSLDLVKASDWKHAGLTWITKRHKNWIER